jgi:hypothetical protein
MALPEEALIIPIHPVRRVAALHKKVTVNNAQRKKCLIFIFLIGVSCSDNTEIQSIKEIEKSIKIYDVEKYDRYYYIENNIAYGTYLIVARNGKILIVHKNEIPKVLDGGCDVINATLDLKSKRVENIFCNESS